MRVIYACDIGSTLQDNFGWARSISAPPRRIAGSRSIDSLVSCLSQDMREGCTIALGFESPLFIPVPFQSTALSRGREGDGDRSWSAPAGAAVTTLGLHQAAWILRAAFDVAGSTHDFTTNWHRWPGDGRPLFFCWEAFVSRAAHCPQNDPVQDAATAVSEFVANEATLDAANAVTANPRLSLIEAAALWSGWSNDISRLHGATLVIQPCGAYAGLIEPCMTGADSRGI